MCNSRSDRTRSSSGFTLIELLVALVVSGILAAAIFQLIGGQVKITERQAARESVQQTTRSVLELISSELRSATGQGITSTHQHAIRFHAPRAWGVVCGMDPGVYIAFPAIDDFTLLAGRHWAAIRRGQGWAETVEVEPAASVECAVDEGPQPIVVRVLSGISAGDVELLAPAYLYQQLAYEVRTLDGRSWIYRGWRDRGVGSMQWEPLAGPVDGAAGMSFRYEGAPVDRVRIHLRSRQRSETYTDSVMVHLRGVGP